MLEDLGKSNVVTLLALTGISVLLPKLLPNMRPALKSAIQTGLTLLREADGEAELAVVGALVSATMDAIDCELATPASDADAAAAVQRRVHHFKRQAHVRARRWAADEPDRHRRYRRNVAKLESALAERKERARQPRTRAIIEDAFALLGEDFHITEA